MAEKSVVIALLNFWSEPAAAATGFVLNKKVLIITGSLVGASGSVLTQAMCRAMNRSLVDVMAGIAPPARTGRGDEGLYMGRVKAGSPEKSPCFSMPHELLKDFDDSNPMFEQTDVALVIGANDVVNPLARTDPASPIAGMPILDVDKARTVVVIKRSLSPGFAGIPNPYLIRPEGVPPRKCLWRAAP